MMALAVIKRFKSVSYVFWEKKKKVISHTGLFCTVPKLDCMPLIAGCHLNLNPGRTLVKPMIFFLQR